MPTLLIVEDNAHLAYTLERYLRDEGQFTIAASVPSAEEAIQLLDHLDVDLVLIDVSLPCMSGIELVEILHKQKPELNCLMLSAHENLDYVRRSLAAGAKGYVLKNDTLAIVHAVNQVLAGETYISDELQKRAF